MKVVFFGNNRFGAIFLRKIIEKIKIVLVVTNPDKIRGRKRIISPSPVKIVAEEFALEVFQPKKLKEEKVVERLTKEKEGVFLLAGFGRIIPKELIDIPQKGFLNIHPSLLPKYRGPSPIQAVILAGERKTGVSIHFLSEEVDKGDIISQKEIILNGKETYLELEEKLANLGGDLLLSIWDDFLQGKVRGKKQDEVKASYTKKFVFTDGEIFPHQEKAEEIERKVRALNPEPGVFLKVKKNNQVKILKILESEILEKKPVEEGKFFEENGWLALVCRDKSLLIKKLQLEGKKPIESKEFLKGNKWLLD